MISLLSEEELTYIKKAGHVLKECFALISEEIREGISTKSLEDKAHDFIVSRGAKAAFRGYKGYPASICVSRNNVVVHGIPSVKETLKKGDIISIDMGAEVNGCFADSARTYSVGGISNEAERLISVTREALYKGIEQAKHGNHVQDISWGIQSFVEARGYNVVRAFVGHGIRRRIHEEPEIPNFGQPRHGKVLEDGMVLAIEPMVNIGTSDVNILEDGWTAVTKDGQLSAHFEHTVIVKGENAEIVT